MITVRRLPKNATSLLIDIGLLVTCGTVSQSELFGEELDMHEEPSREATSTSGQGKILVSYGESVMWSFAAEECQSWFVGISRPFYDKRLTRPGLYLQVSSLLASDRGI